MFSEREYQISSKVLQKFLTQLISLQLYDLLPLFNLVFVVQGGDKDFKTHRVVLILTERKAIIGDQKPISP